ncbi:hypothetical protein [Streptosporangium sandarakinum]|uniref:WXG100-like domain-containing protein n=1 Tax=Streptosporangium sandarakinum TaxID=1260955 RepID=UPI0034332E6F
MGFDGFLVPDWAKPYVGWAVGMDWPEGDESRCFRLADACAATARSVAGEGPLSSQGSMGAAGGVKWDGEALKLFAEHVKKVSGGRQAELVDQLVSAALELNQAGVQVEYTKKMIEVSVWFLIFQIGWLLAASAGPWGALSLALIGPRVQLARMTIQQIAHRLLINLALFGGLGVAMDVGVQLSQSRRDGIDWESVEASAMMGALSGVFLTALPAGLSGLSTAALRAGLSRAEMTAFEKFLAASTNSMWGMMAQSGLANGAATAISLGMSGQFDWEMVLKGTTAGVIGGADAHWAGQPTVRGAGGDGGGPAHGGDGGPAGGPAGGSPTGGTVPRDPGGPSGPGGTAPHDPGGPSGPGGTAPRDPGGPSGPGTAGDLGAAGAHQAGSGRPADPATASGGTGHAPADSATVLAQAVPPTVHGPDGTASPHASSHTAPQAVPPVALRPDGTPPPHTAPLVDAAAPARVPSHAEATAPASGSRNGGGPAASAVRTENPGPGTAAGRVESAGPAAAVTRTEGGSPAHPAAGPAGPGRAPATADGTARPGPGGAAHSGPGTAAHPGPDTAARPGTGTATHPGAGGAARPGPEAAVPTVPAPRDPAATGESAPAARPEAGSIDSLINHGDGQGTATVLAEQPGPSAPQPFPAADPDAVRPPRPITLRDHESFAQSVATGITGPREPLRTGAESLRADRVTLGDGTRAVDKELAGRDARDREYLTSRLGQAVGADVAAVHIAGERRVLVDWVGGERAEVRLNPDGSWEAPGHHDTADGILLGLLDTLTSHYDRFRFPDADLDLRAADIDLRVGENGALRAFDHEKAFQGILPDTRNPFVRHFFRETSPMRVEWAGNPLSRRDIEVLRARIDALEGEFRALGRDDWYANAKFAFDRIAEHAEGTTSLLDAAREPADLRPGRAPSRADGPDALPGSEGPASSGGTRDRTPEGGMRDRTPEGEMRDRASEGGTRDAASADGARGVPPRNEAPSPGEVAARLLDPGGELGRSAAGGARHSRSLDVGGVRAEIVTFGDGRTAMRLTGRDAEAAEAAALTRVALGLDGPAVHRSGDVVYREYGDDALRRSIETGIRETRLIPDGNKFRELVTFNDGRQAFRVERRTIDAADAIEMAALPPRSTADPSGGVHRASETVVYETRVRAADDPDVKPLVWSESPGHEAKRGLYDVLTLGETFNMHTMETNAHGESSLRIERGFADMWDKKLLDGFLDEGVVSQLGAVDFRFRRNGLTGEDAAAVAARLEALRPEFERRGWHRWHEEMTERFEYLRRQARGDQPLLTGPDAVPHGPVLPDATPHDGAVSPVARSADAERPYDPTTTRPDEALERVLRDGDLGRLNEALADPAAHPDDAARARAYAELVDEGLAELPRSRGTVQVRVPVDRLPEGLAAGQEFTARGFLEGVDDPRFLPDMDRSARLVVYGEHTRVGDLSGKPHQVVFEGNSRFKVLGVHETSYGVKEYFVARVSDVEGVLPDTRTGGLPKAPPELSPLLQRHFDEHRETTDAGVWYRDLSDPEDRDLAESARAVRKMDGLFYVDAHGDSDGIYIGEDGLSARELAMLLLNEPGLRPDDVIYLGNCEVGQRAFAQELARETGHVVIAADSMMSVNRFGDMNPVTDGKARTTMTARGRLMIFLPDVPVPPVAWERVRSGFVDPPFFSDGPGAYGGPQSGIRAAEPATRAESVTRVDSVTSAELTTRVEPVPRAEPATSAEFVTRVEPVGRAEPSRPASSDVTPPARTEPSSGRPDPVDTVRPVRDAGEDATPSGEARNKASEGEARDRASEGEARDRASEGEARDRASEGEARDAVSADEAGDAPLRSGAPSPGEAAARLMDPGGKLGESVASGVRHSRFLDAGGVRAEIVTFGDGRTAMRLTGRDAEAAEAAALTRVALGLDGPAVHRSGDVVYREHGDDALRRSIETGVRETRLIPVRNGFWELVTFNDGRRAFRVDHKTIAAADDAEVAALPHRSAAEVNRGLHRASETVVYRTRVGTTDPPVVTGDPEVKPLVWSESYGHAVKRAVYDVLTLGESFTAHVTDTNARGDTVLGIERGFADIWDKTLLDNLVVWDDHYQPNIEYYRFRRNGLADEDAAAMAARLEALWPEFERRGWDAWHDGMVERLELIGWHTGGEKAVLTGPDAVPHGPVLPDTVPHDGAGASAAHDGTAAPAAAVRPADAGWPHDPAGVRPDEALARVLRDGDLGRLNEVLADPAARRDDVARARAYAKLVGEGLAELPRERGTVQVRVPVDRLPEGLAAGQKFTARGFLEGVDDPRFLPDMDRSARLVVYGEHTRVGDLSGRPHQVVFGEGARFKVLGVHETSYGVKEYFVARVSDVEGVLPSARRHWFPKAPPELPPLLRWHFDEHRERTDAGVWYRDLSDPGDQRLAESARAVRKMDGLFYVDAHGDSDRVYIGEDGLSARELAALLLNEPGLRPDDVIYLGNCKVGQRAFAQELARETGHVVIATDSIMFVDEFGDMDPVIGGKARTTMTTRGQLMIFLPDAPTSVLPWRRIRSWITDPPFLSGGPGEHGGSQPRIRAAEPAGRVDLVRSTPAETTSSARTEPSSAHPDSASAVPRARDAVPAGEDVPPSGGARDRASADEPRDRGPGARDAVPADGTPDGRPAGEGAAPPDGAPPAGPRTPDEAMARLPDPGGELGGSAASGVRHSRFLDAGGVRAEIVTFGDGRTAMRLTGRDAEAAEAAALTRVALGLDGPAVHRSGDVVYREYGDDALRRSIETGVRDTRVIHTGPGRSVEIVTFNDGVQARRVDCGSIARADRVEASVLPPRTVADPNGGLHRASETVIYQSRLSQTDVAELRPLVRDESHGHAAKRGLYDVLTLGETFDPHRAGTNASGELLIGVDRDFAGRWGKPALDGFLRRPTSAGPGDFVFRRNGLYWTDVVALHARLEELRPEFERRGWQRWHDDMVERLELLGRHAGGEKALLTGPDAVPHGPALPDAVPHDGAVAPAARPADAGWPRDPAGMRPRQALVELLWEGDLGRLNEVLADPAARPDDVARARAYAELVGEALVELPRSQGTVQVRVPADRLPEGLGAGQEFTARGIVEGVDDPRFLPDMPHSARLIIHGEHTRVANMSGRPGHVMIEGDARFKVLGVHETSYGVKEYFVMRVTEDSEGGTAVPRQDVRPKERPELPDRLRRHITMNREVTDAGVWYRTPAEVLKTAFAASVRAVRKMDGVFYVDGHGNPRGLFIGGEHIPAADLAAMLLNEPGLRPDDVIYLGNCKVGAERYAQEVANRTGHVVAASETLMYVNDKSGDMVALRPDHRPGTMAGRGRLLIFLPEGPVPPAAWERVRSMAEAPPPLSPDGPGGPGGSDGTRPGPGGEYGDPLTRSADEHGGPLSRSADEHGALRHRPDGARETPGADSPGTPDPSHSPDTPGPSRAPDEPAPGTPNPSHSPDAPAVPVRDDGLAASVAGGVRETRVVERGGTRVEVVTFEDGRQAIRLTGRDADAAEMAALVRGAMGMDGPATHRAGDVVYRDYGNESLRGSLATGIRRSELFENAQGRMEELVTFNDGRQAVRTEYIRAIDADAHELTGLPPRFTGAADSGILRAGETVVYSERRVSPGDPRPEGAAWHETPAERTRRGMYTVLTMGDGFSRHEVTVDAHGVHHLRVGEELPARWGGPAIREFLVAHRSPEAAEPPRVTFRQNRLSPQDAAAVSARLEALRPEFARRGRLDWHDGLMDRLGHLARHADGERPVLDGLDGGTGGTGGHAPEAGDWRSRDPRAALSELLTHGDLPKVHDALAGRTGDPGDAARAGAYLDLANAELAGLPHRTGQVEVRVPADWLPGDLAPGREVAFRGLLEGVDDPRFLADAPGSVRLTVHGRYANVGDISGKPHHAMFDANARFKVLAVQESSSGAKNYFLAQVGEAADAPAAQAGGVPRPELTGEALRHFTEHREETRAGVWYRDPDSPHDMANAAASRGALPVDGAFPVFAHGGPEGVYIGGRLLPAEELAALLLNEPRLRPDDVLLLADCEVGHETSSYAQEVADRTGRVVLAPDAFYGVTRYGDGFVGSIQEAPHSLLGRGRLRIFLPEGPVPLTTWEKVRAWVGSERPAHPGSPGHDRVPAALPDGHDPGAATRGLPRDVPGPGRDVPGPGREVSGDDIAYFGRDATGPEHEAPASGSETGSRVPDGPAAHHAGEHGEPVSYTRDMEAFDRVYDDAATRFAEGEPVDAIVPYMTENATDGVGAPGSGRGFGVELEFALPRIPWKDWPSVVESIARELYEAGLAEDPVVYDYHDSGKGYDRGWRLELEADGGIAGEIISPILHDDPASWRDLERVTEIIRSHGGEVTALTGGHVHVGIPDYGTSVAKYVRLMKIYHAFEDVLFRIAQNPLDELGMHRGYDNCLPNTDTGNYRAEFEEVRLYNTGVSAVSMSDAQGLPSDHLEFRLWDGHVDPGIIQTRIKLSLALAELASREFDDIPPPERLGHHEERLRSGEPVSRAEETASFRALVDLLYTRTADKEQLIALFALNRWQPTFERYLKLMED